MFLPENYMNEIKDLCVQHRVRSLYAFGSALTNKFDAASDVDLIVSFDNMDVAKYADNYFDLKFSLEELLNRHVDLLEEQAIRNPYFAKAIAAKKQFLYGH
ncbi:MAG: nucleotidyltransferase [Bacteroidetes bacterium 46-16]|nr:MAG: nucleotidyltransferase [Bacteroidetes bacterium 46-16]